MASFDLNNYDSSKEEDIKADARVSMFFALSEAWKERRDNFSVTANDLAASLGKDKGQVSRVINGTSRTITFETLAVFLAALGYYIDLKPKKIEFAEISNIDAKPHGIVSLDKKPSVPTTSAVTANRSSDVSWLTIPAGSGTL